MLDSGEGRGVDELYETATNTSSMLVQEHRSGAADVIIAAGWSESRVGMALLRLHSEWDGAAKPRRLTDDAIRALAATMPDAKGKPSMSKAMAEAAIWYARELRLLAQSLKSRPAVLAQLHAWALLKGIHADNVGPALLHWMAPTCVVCDGHGFLKVADQPALSANRCYRCKHGALGKEPLPKGAARVQDHMDYCCQVARESLKKRLRP